MFDNRDFRLFWVSVFLLGGALSGCSFTLNTASTMVAQPVTTDAAVATRIQATSLVAKKKGLITPRIGDTASFILSSEQLNTVWGDPATNALPASHTIQSTISVYHTQYSAPTTDRSEIQYVVTPNGILWTSVATTQSAIGRSIPNPFFGASITLSPHHAVDLSSNNIHSINLLQESHILFKIPAPSIKGQHWIPSSVNLYQALDAAVFSIRSITTTGTQSISYYCASLNSKVPILLYTGNYPTTRKISIIPTPSGVLFSLDPNSMHTSDHPYIFFQGLNSNLRIPLSLVGTGPIKTYVSKSGIVTITQGEDTYLINPNLQVKHILTPGAPSIENWFSAKAPKGVHALFLPTLTAASLLQNSLQIRYEQTNSQTFQITATPILGLGVSTSTTPSQELHVQMIITPPTANQQVTHPRPVAIPQIISHFFGKQTLLHHFTLSSQEGPQVTWYQYSFATEKKSIEWFTSFDSHGWQYIMGPFNSPSDHHQVKLFTSVLSRGAQQPPTIPTTHGYSVIWVNTNTDTIKQALIAFDPLPGMHVRMEGLGLQAILQGEYWTTWRRTAQT